MDSPLPETDPESRKLQLAEMQARWIEEQTVYAVERTYTGWLRVGLGALAVAIGTHAILRTGPDGLAEKLAASSFLLVALIVFLFAHGHANRLVRMLEDSETLPAATRFTRLTPLFLLATAAVSALIWMF
ncbi:DUF202 domain-containing protein [Solirhodobacter olei]|uniref:DUF202 domain-containing protein n=1 Tax=Solirhodobacter olei TaxID=2493082 RepID=UPI000FDAF0D2|nr:DUF202 domain-containing protein [Solirhodobacter olei]